MIKIDEKVKGDKYLEMEGVSAITKATKLFLKGRQHMFRPLQLLLGMHFFI
jgi:hypothetical protein